MKLLKNLKGALKSKPGGTETGNVLRGIARKLSNGRFGRGAMMKQQGETNEDRNNRLIDSLGVGLGSANEKLNQSAPQSEEGISHGKEGGFLDRLKGGVTEGSAKALLFPIVVVAGVIGGIVIFVKIFKKKK